MNKKHKYCFKEGMLVECNVHNTVNERKIDPNVEVNELNFDQNKVKVLTNTGHIYKEANEMFSSLPSELFSLSLSTGKYANMIKIIEKILNQTKNVCMLLCGKNDRCSTNLETGNKFILNKLKEVSTLRKLKKQIESKPLFVEPEETAVGLKWKKPKVNKQTNIPDHKLVQATFQYVPILKTLNALFSDEVFRSYYIKYNQDEKHKCKEGVYRDFCCGSTCQSKEVFNDPLSIQLQLGIDDFDVCCPLKSKAGVHKVCATYVQIRNLPSEYKSKLNNIYLVALCTTAYLKPKDKSYNHIAERIVKEIRILENDGIECDKRIIRGSIINIACDNLGANGVFGFTECFVANYYCRFCECDKTECQSLTKEKKRKLRTRASYEKLVKLAEDDTKKHDLTTTKGVKRICKFNDLNFFHLIENMSVDVMHDVNEGAVNYCLFDFFNAIINKKIATADDIQSRVRDFNYSETYKRNKPSLINFDKFNLNQNASQMYCLIQNLPFMLSDLGDKLGEYWKPVETLLQCMQIIYSEEITENDVKKLTKLIDEHLSAVIRTFGRTLTPKQHFLSHYPGTIRRMGPPVHLWTMRLESKHKVLTEISKQKRSFKNPTKTMAMEHQAMISDPPKITSDLVTSMYSGHFSKSMQYEKYRNIVNKTIENAEQVKVHKFVTYDHIEFREGNLILFENRICEILHILSQDSNVFFVCAPQKILYRDNFCNSFVIERETENAFVLDFAILKCKQVFDKILDNNNFHVSIKTLAIAKLLE